MMMMRAPPMSCASYKCASLYAIPVADQRRAIA
jgi:hypothetical protein